ncbi:cyclase family protein [Streptomyces sp. NPDC005435]|uniref:cyclase family protein n=1 Tax=Streptomyces sp. NPDC005435 TaxID=3154464 RepID=UPI0034567568
MTEWLDLSVPVVTGMPVYPGDPEVTVSPALRAPADGVNVLSLHLGSQSGTHVDAPYHIDDAWPRLDELPLSRFAGRAVVADVRGLAPRSPVTPELLAPALGASAPGTVLLLATGWSAHWGTATYADHPFLTPAAAEAVVSAGVRTVAADALSVDPSGPASDPALPAHRVLCGAGGVIAENLTHLDRLVGVPDAEVFLFPLHLPGADGAPVRAVARWTDRAGATGG